MRVAVMSDLHLEFDSAAADQRGGGKNKVKQLDFYFSPPQPDADILILAGDVHLGSLGVDWVARHFSIPAVLIGGNHESYGHELFRTIAQNREKANATNGRVSFLERNIRTLTLATGERVRLLGAILWTDFRLDGTPEHSMGVAQNELEDFRSIRIERGYELRRLIPSDTVRLHRAALKFLDDNLRQPFDGATIVITHHAPSRRSIAEKFRSNPLNPAFASNLEPMIELYQPPLWIHGHMHDSFDYRIGKTRVVCNPRGYFPAELNPAFDPRFVLEM
ncbi:MAG TPA: metallophosphoesterase [Stellaceae bacterium]|nr:metallophosphoesterase [Stellaceae bacterium]